MIFSEHNDGLLVVVVWFFFFIMKAQQEKCPHLTPVRPIKARQGKARQGKARQGRKETKTKTKTKTKEPLKQPLVSLHSPLIQRLRPGRLNASTWSGSKATWRKRCPSPSPCRFDLYSYLVDPGLLLSHGPESSNESLRFFPIPSHPIPSRGVVADRKTKHGVDYCGWRNE